ncbi:unnamed protein product, partial [Hapterophycus canaliculatus]
ANINGRSLLLTLFRVPFQFQFIIADESHYLKSVDAKRSQAVVPLMQKACEYF